MRNELKIGIIVGILVVAGVIAILIEQGGDPAKDDKPDVSMTAPPSEPMAAPPAPPAPIDPVTAVPDEVIPEPVEPVVEVPAVVVEAPAPEPVVEEPVEDEPDVREPRYHVVEKGQTLSEIAEVYYGQGKFWRVINEANKDIITNPDKLKVGWKLRIPYPEEVAEQP